MLLRERSEMYGESGSNEILFFAINCWKERAVCAAALA